LIIPQNIIRNQPQDPRGVNIGLSSLEYVKTLIFSIIQIVKKAQAGAGVAVKIEHAVYQSAKMFGRHFDEKDEILSHITRQSIDVLKVNRFFCFRFVSMRFNRYFPLRNRSRLMYRWKNGTLSKR